MSGRIRLCNNVFTCESSSLCFKITEVSHMVQVRAEGPKAPSPGRCPGLGASALSGRVGLTCESSVK